MGTLVKHSLLLVILMVGLAACGEEKEALKANAGTDFSVKVGEAPQFNGCDSTGEIENYQWTILQAPESKASDAGKVIHEVEANCRFTLEDTMVIEEVGVWVIELEVRDKDGKTAKDSVSVTVQE